MRHKKITLVMGIILLTLLLSACELPASRAPESQPTATSDIFFVTQTTEKETAVVVATATAPAATPTAMVVEPAKTATPKIDAVATPVRPASYTLKSGEWLVCIARRYNLDLSSFLSANGYTLSSRPSAGTVLKIPQSGSWNPANGDRALKSHPTTYTVKSGDTINTIACGFGDVAPEQIAQANGLKEPHTLTPGQTLNIP